MWRIRARRFVGRSPMAGAGFLQSLWPIWEGVWPYLNPMGSVFTHSIRGVECAREVRAAWRAFFLHDAEGARDDAGQ